MSSPRLFTRAALGLAAALAAGSLVATPANAAAPATDYVCSIFGNDLPLTVTPTTTVETLPPLVAGSEVPAGSATIGVSFTASAEVLAGLAQQAGATKLGVSAADFAFRIGTAGAIPVKGLAVPLTAFPQAGDLTLAASGANGAFAPPTAGSYDLLMPATFNVVLKTDSLGDALAGPCSIAEGDGPVLGSVTVAEQDPGAQQNSVTSATGPKKAIKKGKPAKITVVVDGAAKTATGKVTAKEGSKTLGTATLKKGKATFKIKHLKPGTHWIVVSYAGDASTKASSAAPVKVVVSR